MTAGENLPGWKDKVLFTPGPLTTLQIIEEEGLVEQAAELGEMALTRLEDMKGRHPLIGDVRGRGCLLGIELVSDRETRAPACEAAEAVLYKALGRGLGFKTTMCNVLALAPPLITTTEQMHHALDIVEACIAEVERDFSSSRSGG